METLLDRYLATFDTWLYACLMPFNATSQSHCLLAVITLLDQLNPEQFNWYQVLAILQQQSTSPLITNLYDLFDGRKLNIEFTQIEFLTDRDRARSLWINSHDYADLATYILKILGDK